MALWIPVVWMILGPTSARFLAGGEGAILAYNPNGNEIERNVYSGLLALGILVLLYRGRTVLDLLRENWPIVLFFAYCGASTLWADARDISFKRWIKAVGDLVMVMIVVSDPERPAAVKRFFAWASFLLVPTSVLLMEYYPAMGRQFGALNKTVKFVGITSDKNSLGAIGLLFGLCAAWRVLQAIRVGEVRHLVAHGTVLLMALFILRKAESMTSFAVFMLGCSVAICTSLPALARKRALVHLLAATVVALAITALFFDAGAGMVETLGKDPTLTGRTALWDELLAMNANPSFGAGFESFWTGTRLATIWRMHWWHPMEAHNGYIEVFLNLGWVGISLLTLVIMTGYRNAMRSLRRDPQVGGLLLTYVVVGIVYSGSEAGFRVLTPVWLAFLTGALAVPEIAISKPAGATSPVGAAVPRRRGFPVPEAGVAPVTFRPVRSSSSPPSRANGTRAVLGRR